MLKDNFADMDISPTSAIPSTEGQYAPPVMANDQAWQGEDGILLINEKGHISFANRQAERMFLSSSDGLRGKKFGFPLHEGMTEIDVHLEGKKRSKAIMQCSVLPRKRKLEYLVTIRAINNLREHIADPGMRGELLSKVFAHSPIGIIVINLSGKVTVWNGAVTQILGWTPQEMIGNELPVTVDDIHESLSDLWQRTVMGETITAYELLNQKNNEGKSIDLQVWSVLINNKKGMPTGTILMIADLTNHRKVKAHLRHAIGHDPLTGLPNRRQFRNQLTRTLEKVRADPDVHLIIMTLGIDRFKTINKSLGHTDGDLLLQQVSHRLSSSLYEIDILSRTGGDEFSILLRDTGHVRDGTRVSEKLLQAIREPFDVNTREIFLTASIGIAVFPSDGVTADGLIHAADSAMDRSKEGGGDCCQYFAQELDERVRGQLFLEQELHHAIAKKQLYLEYQPQWNLATGTLIGVEALLRWRHPELGTISPGTFIPIAESSGLIVPIGGMVLMEACQQLKQWDAKHKKKLRMSVNVSPRQFQSPSLLQDIVDAIRVSGISPDRIELEITESMMANNIENVTATLQELKSHGICISIDDFGTGYSSLSYLANLPIDTLKIDQSFVKGISIKAGSEAIITSILTLVKGLELRVIAEGIELEHQLAFLKEAGCDEGQGYLMGRPMPPEQIQDIFHRH